MGESPFCEGGAPLPSRRYEGEEEIADAALRAFVRTAIQVCIVRSAPPHRRYSECSPAARRRPSRPLLQQCCAEPLARSQCAKVRTTWHCKQTSNALVALQACHVAHCPGASL